MQTRSVLGMFVLSVLIVVLFTAPPFARGVEGSTGPAAAPVHSTFHVTPAAHVLPGAAAPSTAYPRTVLVETFTAEWCVYCEVESQALYAIQETLNLNVVVVGELHVCYSSSNCGDNYPTSDGTADNRASYYGVTAFPTVFFDGNHNIIGAAPTLSAMETWYTNDINNASAVPGNVSIAQSASVTGTTVTSHAAVTSGVDGTFHAVSYLVEYIGKNDSTRHDLGYVVRGSLVDQTVTLTAGTTTELDGTHALGGNWNTQRLSVITFLQQNGSKIVENANLIPVTTLTTSVSADKTAVTALTTSTVTVTVTNSSTGVVIPGATVDLSTTGLGTLSPPSGITGSDGTFASTFTAPNVSAVETAVVTAKVAAAGYTGGSGTITLTLNPILPSTIPTGLTVTPANQMVALNWTVPASGSTGVTYYVYRSTTETGTFSPVAMSTATSFVDTGVVAGQGYWYKVSAHGPGGFSANTTPLFVNSVQAVPQGLPGDLGWWLAIDASNFSAADSASMALYLPSGFYSYAFGPDSYAFTAPIGTGSVLVTEAPLSISAVFLPRYADLVGTVSPVTATVTIDGTAVWVGDGAFEQPLEAGTYTVEITASGYTTNSSTVTLTPGNTTTMDVELVALPTSSTTGAAASTATGLTSDEMISLVAIAVIGVAAVVGGMMLIKPRKPTRGRPARKVVHDSGTDDEGSA